MIDQSRFPVNAFRQKNAECMAASLGTALHPFIKKPVQEVVDTVLRCLSSNPNQSGYDHLTSIFNHCAESLFVDVRKLVQLEQLKGLAGLDEILLKEEATAIVALSFPCTRPPHSVCLSNNGKEFVLHDSANPRINANSDGVGASVAEALTHVPTNGVAGDVIVFRAISI